MLALPREPIGPQGATTTCTTTTTERKSLPRWFSQASRRQTHLRRRPQPEDLQVDSHRNPQTQRRPRRRRRNPPRSPLKCPSGNIRYCSSSRGNRADFNSHSRSSPRILMFTGRQIHIGYEIQSFAQVNVFISINHLDEILPIFPLYFYFQDVDEDTIKKILTCSKCASSHDYFSEFLKSSCHRTCNRGKPCDLLDAPKDVICSTCKAPNATIGLYLKHIDSAELHKSDWFHCLSCTHGDFPTIRYESYDPPSQDGSGMQ